MPMANAEDPSPSPAGVSDPKVFKGAPRRDLSDATLRFDLGPRRKPSACAEAFEPRHGSPDLPTCAPCRRWHLALAFQSAPTANAEGPPPSPASVSNPNACRDASHRDVSDAALRFDRAPRRSPSAERFETRHGSSDLPTCASCRRQSGQTR